MKILHTSDWHLGQVLYGYDRTDEYISFFNQLREIVRWEMPDAFLVSGDIFDVSNPSSSINRIFKDSILELQRISPEMTIIITAGNHDSASRIDIDRNLWKVGGIHVIGSVDKHDGVFDFNDIIIKVGDKGYVVALPYINRLLMSPKSDKDNIFRKIEEELRVLNQDNLPVVLMSHITVADCDREGHRIVPIGGMDSVNIEVFGDGFDYVALGHIHKPQKMADGRVVYSGSPLAVSFDENYRHTISIVTLKRGDEIFAEEIEIKPLRPLKTIPEEGLNFKKALKFLEKLPDNDKSYVRLNVKQEEGLPVDCIEQAVSRAKGKQCRFCTFKYTSEQPKKETNQISDLKAFEFKEMSPMEVAGKYFRSAGLDENKISEYIEILSSLENEIKREESEQ